MIRLVWSNFKRVWALVATLVAGVLAFVYLPDDTFKNVTQELIALFGLMMAGVLPTMVLTASVLRAGNLSVQRIQDYSQALRQQMTVWIGLFLISLIASLLVIGGKALDWAFVLRVPLLLIPIPYWEIDVIRPLNSIVVMALAIVTFRAISVGNGIISLLRLSTELAVSEARARDDERHKAVEAAIASMPEREGFGEYVELRH